MELGSSVWSLGFGIRVQVLGFMSSGSDFIFQVQGVSILIRAQGMRFIMQSLRCGLVKCWGVGPTIKISCFGGVVGRGMVIRFGVYFWGGSRS